MDRADLFGALRETGMPVAYRDWGEAEPPALPYVVFFSTGSDYFRADDRNYAEAREWCVELYSKAKHDAGEAAVEAVLSGMPVPFNKNEIGPTEDGTHMTAWYFETN